MKSEKAIMARFFDSVMGKKAVDGEPMGIYNELAYHRYEEVIVAAFPRFCGLLEPAARERIVRDFMKKGASAPLIWQMPNEFRRWMIGRKKLIKRWPWCADLLWLEWQELNLMMKTPAKRRLAFDPDRPVALAKTARVRKLRYSVYEKNHHTPQKTGVVLFVQPESLRVEHLVITPFMVDFLKALKKPRTLKSAIKEVAKRYGQKPKAIESVIAQAYGLLWQKGILHQP